MHAEVWSLFQDKVGLSLEPYTKYGFRDDAGLELLARAHPINAHVVLWRT